MTFADFVALPLGVKTLIVTLLWPAIWAGACMTVALVGDVARRRKMPQSATQREAA